MASGKSDPNSLTALAQKVRADHSLEAIGFGLLLIGVLLMAASRDDAFWLVRLAGWTAPWMAGCLAVVGLVVALRERAGYWSAEALVGAELVLLSLQAGTFLRWYRGGDWLLANSINGGANGGMMGTTLGGLLASALGRPTALAVVLLVGLIGFALLVRYTPLIYPAVYLAQIVNGLRIQWLWLIESVQQGRSASMRGRSMRGGHMEPALPVTPSFVPATEPDISRGSYPDDEREDELEEATWAQRRTRGKDRAKKVRSVRAGKLLRSPDLPPIDLLQADAGFYGPTDVRSLTRKIEETLEDFDVPVRVVHVESGPTVTQIGVEPLYQERSGQRRKVRVNRIVNLQDDLALALAVQAIRIEAPVPGRPYVGIEVPNAQKTVVSLRGVIDSPEMREQPPGRLLLPLGRNTAGAPVIMDLKRAPHLLIAGATGSGKSVCINTIVAGLLMQHGPESLKFVMVDPKMVELPGYNGIPHLIGKVITDVDQVMGALTWLLLQMDDRYRLFQDAGVRNIDAYNELARRRQRGAGTMEPLPYIVLIVDELADLMMTAADDVERQLCRLAQMARATGIHMILATQRPSTDVVTGLIKANFPSRIAFAVTSQIDSRVILDGPGAERLLGRGDMLLMRPDAAKMARLQGCFVSDAEIAEVVAYWKQQRPANARAEPPPWNGLLAKVDEEDELLLEAVDVLRGMQSCSTSMLQRKLRVGYPKAARLMEQLEAKGVVGPDMGGGQGREVLLKDEMTVEAAELEPELEMG